VADSAHDAFFIADLRFGLATDDNGLGIMRASAAEMEQCQTQSLGRNIRDGEKSWMSPNAPCLPVEGEVFFLTSLI
jgi:hypothetical protein